jgi:hypothetical protein
MSMPSAPPYNIYLYDASNRTTKSQEEPTLDVVECPKAQHALRGLINIV